MSGKTSLFEAVERRFVRTKKRLVSLVDKVLDDHPRNTLETFEHVHSAKRFGVESSRYAGTAGTAEVVEKEKEL